VATLLTASTVARAEPPSPRPELASTANLDGLYLALGPLGGASVTADGWVGTFGAEVLLVRVRERRPLAALGVVAGAVRFSELERGRLWLDLLAGSRWPLGVAIGVQAGGLLEVDEINRPRAGLQGSLWVYGGIVPYLRVGTVQESGPFFELGVGLPLPVLRW